ncbi:MULTISPECIES: ABC transporter ATP-binding protein [Dehalobacter]|uniref:ATP-binding cassette domain-containing protein n=2 Tax=Dehalobacter restrictus TaxID=55583 RepID=A0A857DG79_9FIRM|nr:MULTISPECIES: ABC transporter ATP-binding protein [Dehalobacter]AHF09704.1 ABC transporter [Dehalobacter restrictus DSM 9455]MCG1025389.1 ABC transporter ATP-binding protein [Dehalobacter sp.]MDJ0306322.1 ABC transporter ATP-binding protein [Dehalobacter sp.]OCZ52747.1 nitrate ABC transporter ATP-binding protein [Dehalobacter sp. TeCB1]QHA00300.1 ATP-binding cassette domain-containing protein [Dehalobacter restrictus]
MTLALKNLSKTYIENGQSMEIFRDLNLTIESGSFVSLIGPSGSGKSTLCNLIAGIEKPDQGQILLDDQEITGMPGHVGYMFQKDLLLPWRTLRENVTLGCDLRRQDKKISSVEAIKGLEHFGLLDFADYYPHQLSGGMKQRGALLRTILFGQPTLLLDEPFGALDALTRREMQLWLLSIWIETKHTVLFITHDIEEAILLSDKIFVLSKYPAEVVEIIDVPFPRPRDPELIFSSGILPLKTKLFHLLGT